MIEELKPCPEMVEKVAEIMYSQPWHRSVTPFAEIDARTQEHFRELARHTLAAITAYDPDKRLSQEVDELKHDLERQMTIANIECNEAERLREALEAARQRAVVLFQAYARGVAEHHGRTEEQFIHDVNAFNDELSAALGVREASRSLIRDIFDIADDRAEFIGRLVTCALGAGAFDDDTPLWREAAAITGRDADTGNLLPARSTRTTEAISDG